MELQPWSMAIRNSGINSVKLLPSMVFKLLSFLIISVIITSFSGNPGAGPLHNLFLNKEEPRLLENLVAINLWNNYKSNVYYLKSQNLDVDFFIEETGTAIQVAYSITNISDDRETKSLVEAAKTLKEAKEFVILTYEEEKELNIDGVKIQVIPVWKWLLKI